MCDWLSIDEFVDLRMASLTSLSEYCQKQMDASQRRTLGDVKTLAACHGLTLHVRGSVELGADLLPTQYLLRSEDRSVDLAIEGYVETAKWFRDRRLGFHARAEAMAISESVPSVSAGKVRPIRI